MGIDFDENGKNEEYEADENEPTGEPGDQGRSRTAPTVAAAPGPIIRAGSAADLVAAIMGPSPQPQTAEAAVEVTEDTYMDEVDKRLELASYYRLLLRDSLFQNASEAAMIVDHEVRGFVRERLGVLVGARSPAKEVEPLFAPEQVEALKLLAELTPTQVTALKMIAGKVLGTASTPPAPATPTAAQRGATLVARPAPAAPTIAKRAVPTAPSSIAQESQPTAEQRRPGPGRPPGSKGKPKLTDKVQAVRKHLDGTEEPLFNKDGSPRMVAVQRIQRPEGALPFPNTSQMTQITAIQAGDHVAKLEKNPEVIKALTGLANSQ